MGIDQKNDRIVHYENILCAFVNVDGLCNVRGAAEKLEQLEARAGQPVDWTEDFEERGNYQCKCRQCGCDFQGHKTRVLCKACALPPCPDIGPIRKLAREVGYAVGEHGSKIRDYDLIAAPWTDEAVGNAALIEHLCKGLNAKVVDGPSRKPCGRYAVCIQISDRWLKHIDLSIMPRVTERESDDDYWLIRFNDPDRTSESFGGAGAEQAARNRFKEISMSWSATLFRSVEKNWVQITLTEDQPA